MPQSMVQNYVHLVFSTKDRIPFLSGLQVREEMHKYLGGICRNLRCPSIRIGGAEDHVHLAIRLSQTIALATLVRDLKRESSKWIKTKAFHLREFHWQAGYGAFSIAAWDLKKLIAYIDSQEEHHKRESFQDELRRLCKQYGVELDERYAWD